MNVAVIDDHALISEAIKSLLNEQKDYTFWKGFESLDLFFKTCQNDNFIPEFLLLDINLKEEDGLLGCEKILTLYPNIIILMLTSLTQPSLVTEAFKKGAKGFLLKNSTQNDLIQAFKLTKEGHYFIHPEISFSLESKKNSRYEELPKLSRREQEVLALIMEEKTTQEIATILNITVSTIESHRASLFSKTGVKNVVGLIKYSIENNLTL